MTELPIIYIYKNKDTCLDMLNKVIEAYFKSIIYGECILVEYNDS